MAWDWDPEQDARRAPGGAPFPLDSGTGHLFRIKRVEIDPNSAAYVCVRIYRDGEWTISSGVVPVPPRVKE